MRIRACARRSLPRAQQSMPNDNIDRAIKKGTGELGGGQLEEVVYEGYGPGGVAIIVDVLTDNRNRVVAELRFILSRHGGNLGESDCVGLDVQEARRDHGRAKRDRRRPLIELALEAGADDVVADSDAFQVMTAPDAFSAVRDAVEAAKIRDRQRRGGQDPGEYGAGFRPYRRAGAEADGGARGSRRRAERRRPTSTSATKRWRSSRRPEFSASRISVARGGGGGCGRQGGSQGGL